MSPGQVLQTLLRIDSKTARILLAAIEALAAVAIVSAWSLDVNQAIWLALYIALLGAAIVFVAETITNPTIRLALGWFTTALLIAVALAFFMSVVFPGSIAPPSCLANGTRTATSHLNLGLRRSHRGFRTRT